MPIKKNIFAKKVLSLQSGVFGKSTSRLKKTYLFFPHLGKMISKDMFTGILFPPPVLCPFLWFQGGGGVYTEISSVTSCLGC